MGMRGARRAAMPDSVVDWWLSPRSRAPRVGSSLERRRPVESESQRAVSLPPKLLEIARDGNHGLYATVSIGGSRRQLDAAGSRTDRAAGSRTETAPRAAVDGLGEDGVLYLIGQANVARASPTPFGAARVALVSPASSPTYCGRMGYVPSRSKWTASLITACGSEGYQTVGYA